MKHVLLFDKLYVAYDNENLWMFGEDDLTSNKMGKISDNLQQMEIIINLGKPVDESVFLSKFDTSTSINCLNKMQYLLKLGK